MEQHCGHGHFRFSIFLCFSKSLILEKAWPHFPHTQFAFALVELFIVDTRCRWKQQQLSIFQYQMSQSSTICHTHTYLRLLENWCAPSAANQECHTSDAVFWPPNEKCVLCLPFTIHWTTHRQLTKEAEKREREKQGQKQNNNEKTNMLGLQSILHLFTFEMSWTLSLNTNAVAWTLGLVPLR